MPAVWQVQIGQANTFFDFLWDGCETGVKNRSNQTGAVIPGGTTVDIEGVSTASWIETSGTGAMASLSERLRWPGLNPWLAPAGTPISPVPAAYWMGARRDQSTLPNRGQPSAISAKPYIRRRLWATKIGWHGSPPIWHISPDADQIHRGLKSPGWRHELGEVHGRALFA